MTAMPESRLTRRRLVGTALAGGAASTLPATSADAKPRARRRGSTWWWSAPVSPG